MTVDLTVGLTSDNLSRFCIMDGERGHPLGWMLPRRGSPLRRLLSRWKGGHLCIQLRLVDEGGLEQEVASSCAWIGCVQRSLNTDGGSSHGGYCFFLSFLNLLEKKETG